MFYKVSSKALKALLPTITQHHVCLVKQNWSKIYDVRNAMPIFPFRDTRISVTLPQSDLSAAVHTGFHIHPAEEMQRIQDSVEAS